jgi:hypothetical protein
MTAADDNLDGASLCVLAQGSKKKKGGGAGIGHPCRLQNAGIFHASVTSAADPQRLVILHVSFSFA